MMGGRNPGTVQFEVWVTREASDAINAAAEEKGITRGEYMQDAIWAGIESYVDEPRERLLPAPVHTNLRYQRLGQPKPGYKGRWSMWVRVRCTVSNQVPMWITRCGLMEGYGSASAYTRHLLAVAIKQDLGKTVPMPPGRTSANLFGGEIQEASR